MTRTILPLALAALLVAGCLDTETQQGPPDDSGNPPGATTSVADVTDLGDGAGWEHPPVAPPPTSRSVKRLTIDMLDDSLPVVAGDDIDGDPIRWTIVYQGTEYDVLNPNVLGGTLGRPDWIEITEESAEPTSLYLKFMDDMARSICERMLEADVARASADDRALVRFGDPTDASDPEAVRDNLRYLSLRFLGERVADDDDASIAELETLFYAGVDAASGNQNASLAGWNTVCVALFTSPAFHLY